jgi:hypothetical protein
LFSEMATGPVATLRGGSPSRCLRSAPGPGDHGVDDLPADATNRLALMVR